MRQVKHIQIFTVVHMVVVYMCEDAPSHVLHRLHADMVVSITQRAGKKPRVYFHGPYYDLLGSRMG
jgi:hypothetical protein